MGIDITVLVVDWTYLLQLAQEDRLRALHATAYSDSEAGWVWPSAPDRAWVGRYEFSDTLGSYKPHFRAAQAWDDVRPSTETALRSSLDEFLSGLIWTHPDAATDTGVEAGIFPPTAATWRAGPLVVCGPRTVARLNRSWQKAVSALPRLREPFGLYAASPGWWMPDLNMFMALLSGWADVVAEADRRRWGVVGLSS
ncbi:hypothetical protein ACIP88_24610 [Streptomyces uncialis]|uniref:hypothetical protein n=1 Tax=Streptomyces uncialis TaxID=1048205 RepID=UPI0037F99689